MASSSPRQPTAVLCSISPNAIISADTFKSAGTVIVPESSIRHVGSNVIADRSSASWQPRARRSMRAGGGDPKPLVSLGHHAWPNHWCNSIVSAAHWCNAMSPVTVVGDLRDLTEETRVSRLTDVMRVSCPDLTDAECDAVLAVLKSNHLSLGPRVPQFEEQFAEYVGSRYAVAVSSGTAALHLSLIASGVAEGDLVVTSPFSFVASANCVLYEHAVPIFVDVDPATGNIDPVLVRAAVDDLTGGGGRERRWWPPSLRDAAAVNLRLKAVLPVHAFGQPADMSPIAMLVRVETRAGRRSQITPGGRGRPALFVEQADDDRRRMIVTNDVRSTSARRCAISGTFDAWLSHTRFRLPQRLACALGTSSSSRASTMRQGAQVAPGRRASEPMGGSTAVGDLAHVLVRHMLRFDSMRSVPVRYPASVSATDPSSTVCNQRFVSEVTFCNRSAGRYIAGTTVSSVTEEQIGCAGYHYPSAGVRQFKICPSSEGQAVKKHRAEIPPVAGGRPAAPLIVL